MGKARKTIGIMACGFLYSSMFLLPYIKYIFYDAVAAASGFNNTQIGFTLSIYIVASIIATIPSGYIADRYDPKKMMVISGVGHAILSFLYLLFIENYVVTLIIYFGLGITSVLMFWSPCFKAVSLAGKPEDQGKLYGWFESFNGVGSMIMNFGALWAFGLIVGDDVGALKAVVIFYAVCSVISTLLVVFLYKSDESAVAADKLAQSAPKEKASAKEIFAVLKMPKVWLFSLIVFGIYGFYVGSSYLTPYFTAVLGVTVTFSGALATLKNYGTRFVGAPVAGVICDKIGRLKFVGYGFVVMIILMIVFIMMPANPNVLIPVMILMFALALVNVSMKGVEFSIIDEIGVDQKVNGMAISIASLVGFNLPDVALHPICGALLDAFEAVTAYKIIFYILLGMLVMGFIMTLILLGIIKKEKKAQSVNAE